MLTAQFWVLQEAAGRPSCDEELGRKLAVAELEVLYLNKFFKQITQRYTEDMKKLEEKVQEQVGLYQLRTSVFQIEAGGLSSKFDFLR